MTSATSKFTAMSAPTAPGLLESLTLAFEATPAAAEAALAACPEPRRDSVIAYIADIESARKATAVAQTPVVRMGAR